MATLIRCFSINSIATVSVIFSSMLHPAVTSIVELKNAQWRLCINPSLGGSVVGLWMGNTPVLRPADAQASHAGQTSAYPLVPYSNRIGHGQMHWNGQNYAIHNGFNTEPHALHGVGFMRAWSVIAQQAHSLLLRLVHQPDTYWPFAFEVEQRFELLEDGLRLSLCARNTDPRNQPMGLGWHPYFVRRPTVTLTLPVHTQWMAGDNVLPREPIAVDGLQGPVNAMQLDHCFAGTGSVALMEDAALRVTLEATSGYWVVYTPTSAPFFCVEPVTHLNNAVQQPRPREHGLVALDPGESLHQTVTLRGQRCA